jgi:hypothetical protein
MHHKRSSIKFEVESLLKPLKTNSGSGGKILKPFEAIIGIKSLNIKITHIIRVHILLIQSISLFRSTPPRIFIPNDLREQLATIWLFGITHALLAVTSFLHFITGE